MSSLPSNLEVYKILCKSGKPTINNLFFLLAWHKVNGFWFKEVRGIEDQCKMALNFLSDTEREWQDNTILGNEVLFIDFFIDKLKQENSDLSIDFKDKLLKEMENL